MLPGLILIALVLCSCLLFFFQPAWFPIAITSDALAFDHRFQRTLWLTGAIFVAAQLLLAFALLRRHSNKPPLGASHKWLEIGWTSLTAAVFLALAFTGSSSWARQPDRTRAMETIEVYAHQFAWSFRYPGPDHRFGRTALEFINDSAANSEGVDPADPAGKDDILTSTLRIPAQRDVLLLLHSRDVVHDFFVRELRTKQDVVPGMEIPLEIHVDQPGTYEIACAELCGLGHSQMRSLMIVMPPAEFDIWKTRK